ncbi:hypothetical protein RFI_26220, partial [Reticulomyxa filosa]
TKAKKSENENENENVNENKDEDENKSANANINTNTNTNTNINTISHIETKSKSEPKWYYFEEKFAQWIPITGELQLIFDQQYQNALKTRDTTTKCHFKFDINDCFYGVRFPLDDRLSQFPFAFQFQLNFNERVRNLIKAAPDQNNCINEFKIADN